MKLRAILFHEHGDPSQVCRCETLDIEEPGRGEALVRMLYAPINPADINLIEGTYATRPPLPAVPGGEGLGMIERVGPDVSGLRAGDRVLMPAGMGSWREYAVVPALELIRVAPDLPEQQAAMLRVNPATAYRMLHDFVELEPGEWIVQNAANSGVGRSAIQIAKAKGWRTLNVVRRPELIEELRAAGADVVLVESADLSEQIVEAADRAPIRLALNAVGGERALRLASCLARSGTLVTYGAMSRQPIRIPNGLLIFKDLRVRGFWVTQWYREASPEARQAMIEELATWVKSERLFTPIDRLFSLEEATVALARAMESRRAGKVLFRM
jgi:trans-2-enoyl-CoA reductase